MSVAVQITDSGPYWRGFDAGEVRLPYCAECAEPHLPAGPVCPYCLCDKLVWKPAAGNATLTSWVIERTKHFAAFDPPYIVGEAQLNEGPRMPVQVDWLQVGVLYSGIPGKIQFSVASNGMTLPKFVPSEN